MMSSCFIVGKAKRIQSYNQAYSQKVVEEDIEDRKKATEKLLLIREKNEANQRELLVRSHLFPFPFFIFFLW